MLNWLAISFDKHDGYGRLSLTVLREYGDNARPYLINSLELPPQQLAGTLTIQCAPANHFIPLEGVSWGYTMVESDSIPDGWVETINATCDRLLVPCAHNAFVFAQNGVTIPISVLEGGADQQEFYPAPKRDNRPFTFLALADRGRRKGWLLAVEAFSNAFSNGEAVRLVIKARRHGMPLPLQTLRFADKRIALQIDDLISLREIFWQSDCFVFPSYAEGWGMPPREYALCGLPVIASAHTGLQVGIDHWAYPITKHLVTPADTHKDYPHSGQVNWYEADIDELIELMRFVYRNQDEAKHFGMQARNWILQNQTWSNTVKSLHELVSTYGTTTNY